MFLAQDFAQVSTRSTGVFSSFWVYFDFLTKQVKKWNNITDSFWLLRLNIKKSVELSRTWGIVRKNWNYFIFLAHLASSLLDVDWVDCRNSVIVGTQNPPQCRFCDEEWGAFQYEYNILNTVLLHSLPCITDVFSFVVVVVVVVVVC